MKLLEWLFRSIEIWVEVEFWQNIFLIRPMLFLLLRIAVKVLKMSPALQKNPVCEHNINQDMWERPQESG